MTLETVLEQVNNEYRESQKQGKSADERDITRNFLLSLSSFGLSLEDTRKALCLCAGVRPGTSWESLSRTIYRQWLLDIGKEEKPLVRPVWGCWLNLESREIATEKPYNPFAEDDTCVWVEDYRIFGDIDWKTLVK